MTDITRIIGETPDPDGEPRNLARMLESIDGHFFAYGMVKSIATSVLAYALSDEAIERGARAHAEAAHWNWSCSSPEYCTSCDCVQGWLMADNIEAAQAELRSRARAALRAALGVEDRA